MKRFELKIDDHLYIAHANSLDELIANNKVFKKNKKSVIEITDKVDAERKAKAKEASDKQAAEKEKQDAEEKANQIKKDLLIESLAQLDIDKLLKDYKK